MKVAIKKKFYKKMQEIIRTSLKDMTNYWIIYNLKII